MTDDFPIRSITIWPQSKALTVTTNDPITRRLVGLTIEPWDDTLAGMLKPLLESFQGPLNAKTNVARRKELDRTSHIHTVRPNSSVPPVPTLNLKDLL